MRASRRSRLTIVIFILLGGVAILFLLRTAFDEGLNVFFTPTEIAEGKAGTNQNLRIGGMVKQGSLKREGEGTLIQFIATDFNSDISVVYDGVLPDLFREGQGVVAEGRLQEDGTFMARQILAKHDENYMSAEVKTALEAAESKGAAIPAMQQ